MPMTVSAAPGNAAVEPAITMALLSAMLLSVSSPNQRRVAVGGGGGIAGAVPETVEGLLMAGQCTLNDNSAGLEPYFFIFTSIQ